MGSWASEESDMACTSVELFFPQLDKKKLHEVCRGQWWLTTHPSFIGKWRCPSPFYHKIQRNQGKRLCPIFWMIVDAFVLLEGFFGDGVKCFLVHKWAYKLMLSPCVCVSARNGKQAFLFLTSLLPLLVLYFFIFCTFLNWGSACWGKCMPGL